MSEAYRISVAIAMASNHNAILSALSSQLLGVHANVNKLQGSFNRLKTAIGGALAVGAGMALFHVMGKLIDKTKEYSHELVKLENLGGDMAKGVLSGDVSKKAFDIAQRVPLKVTDIMGIMGSSNSILGYEDSMKMAEKLSEFSSVMQAQKDYKGNPMDDMSKFLRAGELGGRLTDPTTHKAAIEELEKFLDLSQKVMAATHGMVTPNTMMGMAQQSGFSMRGMTDEGFMNMAIAAQAMGGPRSGTALLSLYNQVATGKMTKPAAIGMENLGLLKPGEMTSDHGRVLIDDAAKERLGKMLGKNPMDFVDAIYQNLEKQGITDPQEQMRRLSDAMSRQTSQRFVGEMMMNREQIAAERGRMGEAAGSGQAAANFARGSVETNEKALTAAWSNFQTAIMGPNSENAIRLLQFLTERIKAFTLTISETNPETIANFGKGIAIIAGALVVGGSVAIIAAAGVVGGIATVLIGMAAAIAVWGPQIAEFGKISWETFLGDLAKIQKAIMDFVGGIASIAGKIGGMFTNPNSKGKGSEDLNTFHSPMSFNPSTAAPKPAPIKINFQIDGRTLGQAVSDQLEAMSAFATASPSANGYGRFNPNGPLGA